MTEDRKIIKFDIEKISAAIQKAFEAEHPEYTSPEPPDDLYKLLDYLPEAFQDESEEQYIDALTLAMQTSYVNELYQFTYLQYHMLFMTAVYYVLLKISKLHPEEFDKALYFLLKDRYKAFGCSENTKDGKLYFGSFAAIGESEVFLLLRVVGLDDSLLDLLKKRVKDRNEYAHANGHLLLTSDKLFFEKINAYNTAIEKIVNLIKDDIISLYKRTITDPNFYDPEVRSYIDSDEQIIEGIVKAYSLSRAEINWLRKIKSDEFKDVQGFEYIKPLHLALCHYYERLIHDGDEYCPIMDKYLHYKYENHAADFVESELGVSAYRCGKEGVQFPVYECPECGEEQLAFDSETGKAHCFACDTDYDSGGMAFCEECGDIMQCNEIGICPNCIDRKMEE